MVNEIRIENFKLFKQAEIPLKTLTLFTGLNGMGKSTVIQIILLLKQSQQMGVLPLIGLNLKGNLVELGTGKDIFHQFAGKDEHIKIEITLPNIKHRWYFTYSPDTDILPISKWESNQAISTTPQLFGSQILYLNAEHIRPSNTYNKSDFEVVRNGQIGKYGEYAVHYLSEFGLEPLRFPNLQHPNARSNRLLHNVEAWLAEVSPGIRIVVEDIKGLELVRLGFQYETEEGYSNEYKPINVGFGISYALPTILALLIATPEKLTIIENPESHVHPQGQAKLGELIALSSANFSQILIETHSDHIINGIRVAVKEEKLMHSAVGICYFDRVRIGDDKYESRIENISIDQKGELSEYPKGLLDEWSSQLFKLI